MSSNGLIDRLREALQTAGYTHDAVLDLLGAPAHAALARNETTPGLRATTGGTPLETLTRLWLLQEPVPLEAADAALPGLVDELCGVGILVRSISEVAARVDLRPYGVDATVGADSLWVLSDLTPGLDGAPNRVGTDHVLGISSAATSLAELTIRTDVDRALDLGTGCGVQAMHLAGHAAGVVATDVNRRALWLAGLNAELNGLDNIEIRDGSFFEPVRGERFDLITSNPPFVISPGTGERLVYRDSGLPGDRVVEQLVRQAPRFLNEGGTAQLLVNWMVLRDRPWEERVGGWLSEQDGLGCDAWVVQRERVDLPTYVELWLKDAGQHPATGAPDLAGYRRRYDTWLSWLEEQGAEAVGFGWINLRRTTGAPVVRVEDWPWEVTQPIGPEVDDHFTRIDRLRNADAGLDDLHLRVRGDVQQEALGAPGAEDPSALLLRQQAGLRRARQVDTATAAFVGACDGELSVAALRGAVEQLTGAAPDDETLRELVVEGWLEP